MIFCLAKRDTRALLQVSQHFLRKIDVAVQARADRSSPQRKLAQNFQGFLRPLLGVSNLLRVAGKFLAEADRRRVHQMRTSDLDDVPEFILLRFMSAL